MSLDCSTRKLFDAFVRFKGWEARFVSSVEKLQQQAPLHVTVRCAIARCSRCRGFALIVEMGRMAGVRVKFKINNSAPKNRPSAVKKATTSHSLFQVFF